MKSPPKWAQDLTLNTLLWWESQGNKVPNISIEWKHRKGKESTGTAFGDSKKIIIRQGSNKTDAKLVLLHEIAHQLAKVDNIYEHHTMQFWEIAWQLYRWAKLPIKYCRDREGCNFRTASLAYSNSRHKSKSGYHYWMIESDGKGICKFCGENKQFCNYFRISYKYPGEDLRKHKIE